MTADRAQQRHDVIIVGAGPSGASAAALLGRKGVSVLLLDKARFPRQKCCAGMLTEPAANLMRQLLPDGSLDRLSVGVATGCSIYHRRRLVAEVLDGARLIAVNRQETDAAILASAERAGCQVRQGCKVIGIDPATPAVTLQDGTELRAELVVGADGAGGVTGRCVDARRRWRRSNMGIGLKSELPLDCLSPEVRKKVQKGLSHIYLGNVNWGYEWVFPKGDVVTVGVAGLASRNRDLRGSFDRLVRAITDGGVRCEDLDLRGHPVPGGNFMRRPGRGRTLLVGDAAGLAEPITGEGIRFALRSGMLAADAISRSLAKGRPEDASRLYNAAFKDEILPTFTQARLARQLLFPRVCLPLAMRTIRRHPTIARLYMQLLAGQMTYRQFFVTLVRRALHIGGP